MLQTKAQPKNLSHLNYGDSSPWALRWLCFAAFSGTALSSLMVIRFELNTGCTRAISPECLPRARFDNCRHASVSICDLLTFALFMKSMCRKEFHVFNTCKFLTKIGKQDSRSLGKHWHSLENSSTLLNTCKFSSLAHENRWTRLWKLNRCTINRDTLFVFMLSMFITKLRIYHLYSFNNRLLLNKMKIKEDFELI